MYVFELQEPPALSPGTAIAWLSQTPHNPLEATFTVRAGWAGITRPQLTPYNMYDFQGAITGGVILVTEISIPKRKAGRIIHEVLGAGYCGYKCPNSGRFACTGPFLVA